MYADYAYYTGTYKGTAIPEAQFAAYEQRAAEEVNQATFNRAADNMDASTGPSIKGATCAVADVMFTMETLKPGTQVVSETTGGQSETRVAAYKDATAWRIDQAVQVRAAIRKHLLWTGILNAVIGAVI
jgi:hypothetical protein